MKAALLRKSAVFRRRLAGALVLASGLALVMSPAAQGQSPSTLYTWPGTGDLQGWDKNFGINTVTLQNSIAGELTIIENGTAGSDIAIKKNDNEPREGSNAGGGLDLTGLDWIEFDLGHNGAGPIDVQFYVQATPDYSYRALGPDVPVTAGVNTYRLPLTGLTLDEAVYIRPLGFNARTHTALGNVTWTLREVRAGGTPRKVRELITHNAGTPEGGLQSALINFGNEAVLGNDGGQNQSGLSHNPAGSGSLQWTDLGSAAGGAAIAWGNGTAFNGNTFNSRITDLSGYNEMIVRVSATKVNAADPNATIGLRGYVQTNNFNFQSAGTPSIPNDGLYRNLRFPLTSLLNLNVTDVYGLQIFDHANDVRFNVDNIRFQNVTTTKSHTLFSWEGGFEGWTEGPEVGHVHSLVSTGATSGAQALQIDRRSVPGTGGDEATNASVAGSQFTTTNAAQIADLTSRINSATKIAFDVTYKDESVVPAPGFTNFFVSLSDHTGPIYRASTDLINVNTAFNPVTTTLTLPLDGFFDTTAGSVKNLGEDKLSTTASQFTIALISNTDGGSIYQIDNFRLLTDIVDASADFDENLIVNGVDFNQWKTNFGTTHAGDADGDGDSDGKDFLTWQAQFGGPGSSPAAAVPEPSAGLLGLAAWAVFGGRRRRA